MSKGKKTSQTSNNNLIEGTVVRRSPVVMDHFTRKRVQLECDHTKGQTQQHFKDEVNINNIVKRFEQTGLLEHTNNAQPQYGEATGQTFTEAMFMVREAEENFMQLPSEIRREFGNDVSTYLDAIGDPSKMPMLAELGLIDPDLLPPAETGLEQPVITPEESVEVPSNAEQE